MKTPRNKTIDISLEDSAELLERCISVTEPIRDVAPILDRTIIGDSFTVMEFLPRGFADLVIADPPYNLRKSYDGTVFTKKSAEEYRDYTVRWLKLVYPLMREGATLYFCCDWETSVIVAPVLSEMFTVRGRITWQREKGRGAKDNWKSASEDIWYCTKGKDFTFNLDAVRLRRRVIAPYRENGEPKDWVDGESGKFRDTCPSDFWDDITVPFWSMAENTAHPTQKPEKLVAKLILASSNEGEIVFDPFLGSGTSSVTAKKLGRHYLGIEKEPRYCAFAEERLRRAESDKRIQGFENGIFFERNSK